MTRALKELEVEGAQVMILKALDNKPRASFTFLKGGIIEKFPLKSGMSQ